MSATAPATIELDRLTKVFANTGDGIAGGIRDASVSLDAGTFFTLLGPSGCGKTTTLRCIAGLEEPDSGTIRVGDRVFFDSSAGVSVPLNLRRVGMVFQSYAIWPHMTVFENVAFPLRVARDRKYSREEIESMVRDALRTVDLDGFQQRSATRLSGGQQQRVALARAIVHRPSLLLLDEPLSNLDAALRDEMRNELKRLQKQLGISTIYVTHDQSEALEMSDQIAVINRGAIVQLGTPHEIYFDPADAFVARFIGTTNILNVASHSGGAAGAVGEVKLGQGTAMKVLFPRAVAAADRLVVSVRPEAMTLSRADTQPANGSNRLSGTVQSVGFLGNMSRYKIDLGGGETVIYNGSARGGLEPGSAVALDVDPASAVALVE